MTYSTLALSLILLIGSVMFKNDSDNKQELEQELPAANSFEEINQIRIPLNPNDEVLPETHKKVSGPNFEKYFFERWHYPDGFLLEPEYLADVWDEISKLQTDAEVMGDAVNEWRLIGPYGSDVPATTGRFSGRVTDIEIGNTINPVISAASGGLWSYFWILPYSLNDQMNTQATGSFATYPGNGNIILLGTGEPSRRTGTGLYRSTNSGSSWTKITLSPQPSAFYRIRHEDNNPQKVHAATTAGYYRSTDGGLNWTRTLTGNVSDIAINQVNSNKIYAGINGGGIYKSTNNGVNWTLQTAPGLPATNYGRISLTIGTSNSNKVYAGVVNSTNDQMLGVYMTSNDGTSWNDVSPPENIYGGQGWYNNEVGVCPTNSNIILAGGVRLWRSSNSGTTWTKMLSDNIHADQHAIEWSEDGQTVYIGNDGGIAVSTDQGLTFSNSANYLPITQYVNFDVGVSNRGVIYGGSQDNGFTGTTNGGSSWIFTKGGDGGGVAIDPHSALYVYGTAGAYNGSWKFRRYKSTDKGITWSEINNGVDPSSSWYTKMRSDRTHPIKLYTNSGPYVYYSSNQGDDWIKLNNTAFSANVANINVSKYTNPGAIVYASLSSASSGTRLRVYENGTFQERSTGLPSGLMVTGVATHVTNTSKAYALMSGSNAGEKVYKTTNRGVNWTNISGNLPNVFVGDLLPHPTNDNILYLGTEMGSYKTTNGGQQWIRWNNGMPEASIVTEFKWIDSTLDNGKFYIVASTYGRSIWVRDISGDDPVNTLSLRCFIEGFYNPATNRIEPDTVRAYLRNVASPYTIVDSSKGFISNSGNVDLPFFYAEDNTQFYLEIRHRNALETWSSQTISFNNHTETYDFTDDPTTAFGDNQKEVDRSPLKFGLFGGDVNRDGTIDASDALLIDNDAFSVATGYLVTDLNGDDIVDGTDQVIVDNNSYNFVSVIRP